MNNKALWDSVCMTDPQAVKPITGKQYRGNSPKPYWIIERMTDTFGPCGIGWGFTILSERMERLSESDVLHIAVVRLWYELDGKRGELEQIGQTKAVYAKSAGGLMIDEDAPKKSVTDALVKCASYLGFAGDIFSGRWDDSRYVDEVAATYEAKRADQWAAPLILKLESCNSKEELAQAWDEAKEAARARDDAQTYQRFKAAMEAAAKAIRDAQQTKEAA